MQTIYVNSYGNQPTKHNVFKILMQSYNMGKQLDQQWYDMANAKQMLILVFSQTVNSFKARPETDRCNTLPTDMLNTKSQNPQLNREESLGHQVRLLIFFKKNQVSIDVYCQQGAEVNIRAEITLICIWSSYSNWWWVDGISVVLTILYSHFMAKHNLCS